MSWFGDVLGFEGFNGKEMLHDVLRKPQRLLYGSADPFSTKLWNGILGTHDKPIVDQMGGATQDRYRDAQAAGINTGPGKAMQNLAHIGAAFEAGGYGLDALGGLGGGAAGAGEGGAAVGDSGGAGGLFGDSMKLGGGGSSGSAAGGMDWGGLLQGLGKGQSNAAGSANQSALKQQEQIAEQMRRNYEQQLLASQAMPGWVNTSGA